MTRFDARTHQPKSTVAYGSPRFGLMRHQLKRTNGMLPKPDNSECSRQLVRHYEVTDASVHDSQVLDDILDGDNTALGVWADSAYRSAEIEAALKAKGLRSRIHRKGRRNKPLSDREKQGNKTRSSVRVRVEHVFGAQSNDMGGTLVRSIGKVRATARIGLKNLAYNMRRLVQLERLGAATA